MSTFLPITDALRIPLGDIRFRTSRSSGPGGQHVNKVESKVELLFDVGQSSCLTDHQRELIRLKLHAAIDSEGLLRIVEGKSRSQWKNKQEALRRLQMKLRFALRPVKKRRKTAPTRASVERRLQAKKLQKEKKSRRRSLHD